MADDRNHFVRIVANELKPLQDMLTLFRTAQVVLGAPCNNFTLKIDVMCQYILQRHHLRHAAHKREHNDSNRILKLAVTVQTVQHHLRICVAL